MQSTGHTSTQDRSLTMMYGIPAPECESGGCAATHGKARQAFSSVKGPACESLALVIPAGILDSHGYHSSAPQGRNEGPAGGGWLTALLRAGVRACDAR